MQRIQGVLGKLIMDCRFQRSRYFRELFSKDTGAGRRATKFSDEEMLEEESIKDHRVEQSKPSLWWQKCSLLYWIIKSCIDHFWNYICHGGNRRNVGRVKSDGPFPIICL